MLFKLSKIRDSVKLLHNVIFLTTNYYTQRECACVAPGKCMVAAIVRELIKRFLVHFYFDRFIGPMNHRQWMKPNFVPALIAEKPGTLGMKLSIRCLCADVLNELKWNTTSGRTRDDKVSK